MAQLLYRITGRGLPTLPRERTDHLSVVVCYRHIHSAPHHLGNGIVELVSEITGCDPERTDRIKDIAVALLLRRWTLVVVVHVVTSLVAGPIPPASPSPLDDPHLRAA